MSLTLSTNLRNIQTYQCACEIQPRMVSVKITLGCMVTVVGEVVVLHQKSKITKLPPEELWRITGISVGTERLRQEELPHGVMYYNGKSEMLTHMIPGTRLVFTCPTGFPPPNHFLVALKNDLWRPLRAII